MKTSGRTKILAISALSVFLFAGVAFTTTVFATNTCLSAGSTGLTTVMIATSHQKITGVTINAAGCDIGIYVGPGTKDVQIVGTTVTGANEHGIFVQDASHISIKDNLVTHNGVAGHACPPSGTPPSGCISEDKAIELVGTSNSVVAYNVVSSNSADGGIGVADDGPLNPGAPNTHPGTLHQATNDVVEGNLVNNNANGCGIVIASYNTFPASGEGQNTVNGNNDEGDDSNSNSGVSNILVTGNSITGQAPTSGQLFPPHGSFIGQIVVATDGPNAAISNVRVADNRLEGSELPGIVVHSNVFGDSIVNVRISGNTIAENGYYPGPPATNPNDPGVSQGTVGIALIAEVGVQPPKTTAPILAHTTVVSNTVLADGIGVWLCGTTNTHITNLQGNPTTSTTTCHAGGS